MRNRSRWYLTTTWVPCWPRACCCVRSTLTQGRRCCSRRPVWYASSWGRTMSSRKMRVRSEKPFFRNSANKICMRCSLSALACPGVGIISIRADCRAASDSIGPSRTSLPSMGTVLNDLAKSHEGVGRKKKSLQWEQYADWVWKYPVFLAGERGKLLALCIFG